MAKFKIGDKVKVNKPKDWPDASKFTLNGAEGTVGIWVDWPEAMDPYSEYIYVTIDRTSNEGKLYEGANLIFHEDDLEKIK